jgi:DNA replication protein DnaC
MDGFHRLSDILSPDTSSTRPTQSMPVSTTGTNASPSPPDRLNRALEALSMVASQAPREITTICPICGGTGAVIVVPSHGPNQTGPRYRRCVCIDQEIHAQWMASSGIPPRYRGLTFEDYAEIGGDARAVQEVQEWAAYRRPGQGDHSLLLFGEVKQGKTTLATCALADRISAGQRGAFIKAPELLAEIRASFDRGAGGLRPSEILDRARTVPLLVLDDLGSEQLPRESGWIEETLYRLIDYRHDYLLPMIVTTNLGAKSGKPFQDLLERVGDRIAWRLREMCEASVVRVGGKAGTDGR